MVYIMRWGVEKKIKIKIESNPTESKIRFSIRFVCVKPNRSINVCPHQCRVGHKRTVVRPCGGGGVNMSGPYRECVCI